MTLPVAYRIGDGLVLLGRHRDRLHVLNATGRLIWEARAAGRDVSTICASLSRRLQAPLKQAQADVKATLEQWRAAGLLDQELVVQPPAPAVSPVETPLSPVDQPRHWSGQRAYRLFDQGFSFRFGDDGLQAALDPLLAHLASPGPADTATAFSAHRHTGVYHLSRDDLPIGSYEDLGSLQLAANREVALLGCEARDTLTVLHAGGVSDGQSAIVMPAPGGSGKSTLTAALITRGLRYLGDDLIPLERHTQHAVPVPACMNLKDGSLGPLRPLYPGIDRVPAIPRLNIGLYLIPPSGFRKTPPTSTYRVRHILFPRYEPGARASAVSVTPIEALQRLVVSRFEMDQPLDPDKIGELVAWLDRVPASSLSFDNLEEACDCIQGLFAA